MPWRALKPITPRSNPAWPMPEWHSSPALPQHSLAAQVARVAAKPCRQLSRLCWRSLPLASRLCRRQRWDGSCALQARLTHSLALFSGPMPHTHRRWAGLRARPHAALPRPALYLNPVPGPWPAGLPPFPRRSLCPPAQVLSDVVESLIGAVYVDTAGDLDVAWSVTQVGNAQRSASAPVGPRSAAERCALRPVRAAQAGRPGCSLGTVAVGARPHTLSRLRGLCEMELESQKLHFHTLPPAVRCSAC